MDLEKFMQETPRDKWPRFIQEAADRAVQTGKSVQQILDEDRERLIAQGPIPDESL